MAAVALRRAVTETIANAMTGPGVAPNVYSLPSDGIGARFSWQVVPVGAFTALTVVLEGSLDGVNFFQLDTTSSLTGTLNILADLSVSQIRAHVTVFTGGTSVTVLARTQ